MAVGFKERLKDLRIDTGLTQEKLSDQFVIPDSTIRRYETNRNMPKRSRIFSE
ncbi:helix-turn-helix domain-containing protein [Paenibacillus cremeus]|uniref:Helix-turn-helix transcriptional regulator n=1 Tax=Paenibacillus cremeus TaxID=2163881 RepID=A0A559K0J0_9BACL|nr:helix-turn-helix transcriptional regulator [Paenibacillus cremeus]